MRIHRLSLLVLFALVAIVGCGGNSQSTDSKTTSSPAASPPAESPAPTSRPAVAEVAEVAEGWGHLKGQFIYDGSPPAPSPLKITKDPEFCGQHRIVDESLLVNGENRGLKNAVVYLSVRRGQDAPGLHESYAESADAQVSLDNDKCRFEPHICLLRTSQTLLIKNSDAVGHNTNIAAASNASFNQTIPSGGEIEHHFDASERRPAAVSCNIHPWMKGWVLPIDSPYFAVSGENGEFEINNLPSGTWTFQVWHEIAGGIGEVEIDGKTTKWSRGRVELTINADAVTDLGEIKVSEAIFQ